jgi:hypothetical protein
MLLLEQKERRDRLRELLASVDDDEPPEGMTEYYVETVGEKAELFFTEGSQELLDVRREVTMLMSQHKQHQ